MREDIIHFLPSLIRGVYRYDDELSNIKDNNDEVQDFLENKLKFLPDNQFSEIFSKYFKDKKYNYSSNIQNKILKTKNFSNYKNSYNEYFNRYIYFNNQLNNDNNELEKNNFLEAEFIKRVLSTILILNDNLQVEPQTSIGPYFADFTIKGDKKFVFEIDGFGKYSEPESLDKFLDRQNYIMEQGWQIYRYSYKDIMYNTERTKRKVFNILFKDNIIKKLFLKNVEKLYKEPTEVYENKYTKNQFTKILEDGKTVEIIKGNYKIKIPKEVFEKDYKECNKFNPLDFVNNFYLIQDTFINHIIQENYTNKSSIEGVNFFV